MVAAEVLQKVPPRHPLVQLQDLVVRLQDGDPTTKEPALEHVARQEKEHRLLDR